MTALRVMLNEEWIHPRRNLVQYWLDTNHCLDRLHPAYLREGPHIGVKCCYNCTEHVFGREWGFANHLWDSSAEHRIYNLYFTGHVTESVRQKCRYLCFNSTIPIPWSWGTRRCLGFFCCRYPTHAHIALRLLPHYLNPFLDESEWAPHG